MNPKLQPLFIREKVIQSIRAFFDAQDFHEVITPTLNAALPLEPNLYAFSTEWKTRNGVQNLYMAMSPEMGLKKMLAEGIGNCYAVGKSFRNLEGVGSLHNPEFLMLEWYRENSNYEEIMEDTEQLILFIKRKIDNYLKREPSSNITFQGKTIDLKSKWPRFSLVDLFQKYADINLKEIIENENKLEQISKKKGYNTKNAAWHELFDQVFVNEIESQLPDSPFFIIDFPSKISPLCDVRKDKPYLAERFEMYLFGKEIGNGNTERTDRKIVEKRMQSEKKEREEKGLFAPPIDLEFLAALEKMNSKKYGGIGLGVDRLAMIMADCNDIAEVEFFAIKKRPIS